MPEHKEKIILEPFFILTYYGGMTWETYMKFPVAYRKWLIDRISKEIENATKAQADIPTKTPHHNDAAIRTMLGKTKPVTPNARMQRFT